MTLLAQPKPQNITSAPPPRPSRHEAKPAVTFYHDPDCDNSVRALAHLRAAGCEPWIVDYLASPPIRDELKRLSALLQGNSQSLVRRYDRLFLELQLDDRFISENDFWDAIVEHPSLINGPVVASAGRAAVCQSKNAVEDFLSGISSGGGRIIAAKPKRLSERALRILAGEIVLPHAANENSTVPVVSRAASDMPVKPESAPEVITKASAAPVAKVQVAAKRKSTTGATATAKKAAPKPGKKSERAENRKTRKKVSRRR